MPIFGRRSVRRRASILLPRSSLVMKSSRQSQAARRRTAAAAAIASVGAGILGTQSAEAEIVPINIGPTGFNITGVNGGVAAGTYQIIRDFPISGNNILTVYNGFYNAQGLTFNHGFAFNGTVASPHEFLGGATIDSGSNFENDYEGTGFRVDNNRSPAFGDNSYLGFKTYLGNYGWIKATWNGTDTFRFRSRSP